MKIHITILGLIGALFLGNLHAMDRVSTHIDQKRKRVIADPKSAPRTSVLKTKRMKLSRLDYQALLKALNNGNVLMVCKHLEGYPDINVPLYNKISPLHIAVQKGFYDLTVTLVETYHAHCASDFDSPFYKAIYYGQTKIVDYLITQFQFNVNRPVDPETGNTPLHIAIAKKNVALAKKLIDHRAYVSVFNKKGIAPLGLLGNIVPTGAIEKIFDYFFIDCAFSIDMHVDASGSTLLHLAAANGNGKLVSLLLEKYHANPEVIDFDYATPFARAQRHGYLDISKAILNKSESCCVY